MAEEAQGEAEHGVGGLPGAGRRGRALRELRAARGGRDRYVRVGRLRQAEGALHVELRPGGNEEIGAPHDLGDPESAVVHDRREMVGVDPVRPAHDEVARFLREVELHVSLHPVAKGDPGGRPHPDGSHRTGGAAAAGPGIGAGSGFASGTRAPERPSLPFEPGESVPVVLGVRTLMDDRPVPGQGEALQLAQDHIRRPRHRAGGVHVVDAHVPLAASAPHRKVAREGRDHGPEVQRAVRGRGEPAAPHRPRGVSRPSVVLVAVRHADLPFTDRSVWPECSSSRNARDRTARAAAAETGPVGVQYDPDAALPCTPGFDPPIGFRHDTSSLIRIGRGHMRLRKILLAGFKSFVDPVTIELPGELIGIVGPNGCGKSNVIDAVRWVMGESSARQLRGELLVDVIFNGAASRRPVGQASVELRFDNSEGRAGGRFAGRGEISIRRIVNREGQSTYYLNGSRCRRRDVTDLFLGTGLGPRSYAIIEQGTISRLIEAKPEELRAFLEEAAGISLYRERRRETESRMRQTEDNLARLADLREELDKQLARLKRQAADAERYTALRAEERRLRSELLALRWRALEHEAQAGSRALGAQEVKLEAARARQRTIEAAFERTRAAHQHATDGYNERYRATLEVRTEVGRAEEAIAQLRRQREELRGTLARDEQVLAETDAEAEVDGGRLGELEGRLGAERARLERAREEEGEAERNLRDAERALAAFRTEHEELRARREACAREAQAAEAALAHHRVRLGETEGRLARLGAERESLAEADEDDSLGREVEALKERIEAARERLQERQRSITGLRRAEADAAGALHDRRERLEAAAGRLASLEALQQAALARESGEAADWLEANDLAAHPRLAQIIEVEPEWAYAMECVLGSRLEAVRVDDVGRHAPELEGLDRATVSLVAETGPEAAADRPEGAGSPAASGRVPGALIDRIRTGRELAAPWLAGVGTDRTAASALERSASLAPGQSLVTPDGTWVGPNWIRVFRQRDGEAGPLAREREIGALRRSLGAAETEVREHEAGFTRVRGELAEAEREREALEAQWAGENERYTRLRSEYAAREAEAAARRRRREDVGREIDELTQARRRLAEAGEQGGRAAAAVRAAAVRLESEGEVFERRAAALEAGMNACRDSADRTRQGAHEAALGIESTTVQVAALREARRRSAARREALRAHLGESRERLAGIETPITEAEERLRGRLRHHREMETALGEAREAVEARENEVRERDRERGAMEIETDRERTIRDDLRLEWKAALARRDAVAEQLAEAGFEAARVASDLPPEADPDGWQESLARIERRLERLGPVNLAAVTEFETASQRKQYLDSQHGDLTDALATLQGAIRKIDRETRVRFKDTFERVGVRLQEIFPRLFGGGDACLELTGEDLLDTGVTIMARPPGKRNASVQLLSGGEKALAAVALVFALFDLNPAPFCLLDEVDAPLDDANVDRFVDLVRELSERVQIMLVTHNKSSMEAMGQLVGVTMNEPGVSRLVSVDVGQALDMAAA